MSKRGIMFVGSIALIALAGCVTRAQTNAVAQLAESDVRPSALPTDLVGTRNGSFWTAGADGGGVAGNITLAISGDGTYTGTERRRASLWNASGVVVADGRSITLRSASGRSVSLVHRGDALYASVPDRISGYRVQVSVVKDSGALASPAADVSSSSLSASPEPLASTDY